MIPVDSTLTPRYVEDVLLRLRSKRNSMTEGTRGFELFDDAIELIETLQRERDGLLALVPKGAEA
jgi:hypothetical protein